MPLPVFERYVLPVKDKMFRFAYRMLGNSEDARDIVQDALLKIWNQKDQLEEIRNPEAWSMQVVKNLCLDRHKMKKIRINSLADINVIPTSDPLTPYQKTEQKDNIQKVRAVIEALPEKFKMIIHLREIEEYSYKEIAEILELSMDEVKINLYRARQLLKDQLIKNKIYGLS